MKASKYIYKFALINIWHKKKRTYLSIVAVCLSTAIFFTSLTLFKNIYHFSKSDEIKEIENYHYALNAKMDITLTPRYQKTIDGNTGLFGNYHQRPFHFRHINESQGILPFQWIDGTWPSEVGEIVVSDKWQLSVGDQLELTYGTLSYPMNLDSVYRVPSSIDLTTLSHQQTQTFIVSGVYKENEKFNALHQGADICYTNFPITNDAVYYIVDSQVQTAHSFEHLIDLLGIDSRGTFSNADFISLQVIQLYLQDTAILLVILIMIIGLSLTMSFISINNVIIISDKERKKEIGLLKSVGATSYDISKLLRIELLLLGLVGAIVGVVIGIGTSYLALKQFCKAVYIYFDISMIMNGVIIFSSLLIGVLLMYFSGMKAYRQYIHSSPMADLKDEAYQYDHPVSLHDKYHRSFEFRMFSIYNQRMKPQTKNILYSFILLFATTVLFMSVVLSNQEHRHQYQLKGYDFEIMNLTGDHQFKCPNPKFANLLYNQVQNNVIECKSAFVERTLMSTHPGASAAPGGGATAGFYSLVSTYHPEVYDYYKKKASLFSEVYLQAYNSELDESYEDDFCNVYYTPAVLDEFQINKLKPYLQEGSLENLAIWDVVAILHEGYLGTQFCENLKVGDKVYYGGPFGAMGTEMTVKAIVVLPVYDSKFDLYQYSIDSHYSYYNKERVMAFSLASVLQGDDYYQFQPNEMGTEINEHIYIDLQNEEMAADLQTKIDQLLIETGSLENYRYVNYALLNEASRMTIFLIETLLYPLLFMLFIVSIMNMHNVFTGNIHLKLSDISMMKSIGMTNKQSRRLFTYEYEEGYMNAMFWMVVIFVPLALIETELPIDSSFSFGANIVGTLILSLLFLDILIVIPLVAIALRKVKKIEPLNQVHQSE